VKCFHDLREIIRGLILHLAGLAGLQIGGECLACIIQHPREILREGIGVEALAGLCAGKFVAHAN
jgi:hypothetical protein